MPGRIDTEMNTVARMTPIQRAALSLDGLTIGDAFGQCFFVSESSARRRIDRRELPPPPWIVTDDSIMAIGIVNELERHGRIDRDSLAEQFAEDYRRDPGRGYGAMAHEILRGIHAGGEWSRLSRSAFGGGGSFGNGAAMRVAPLGAFFAGDPDMIAEEAGRSAEVTHSHPEGIAGAIAVALAAGWASNGSNGSADGAAMLDHVLEGVPASETRDGIAKAAELEFDCPVEDAARKLGSGSRISAQDTVPFVLWCAAGHLEDYADALWTTVEGLGDRDTTCAMVGGIVALAVGIDGIPGEWRRRREPLGGWLHAEPRS